MKNNLKKFSWPLAVIAGILFLLLCFFQSSLKAATSDYDISNGDIIISQEGEGILVKQVNSTAYSARDTIRITGSSTIYGIQVQGVVEGNILLDNVSIDCQSDSSKSAFSIAQGSNVNLFLEGVNHLVSGELRAGLEVEEGNKVTIASDTSGKLTAESSRGAGIGAHGEYNVNGNANGGNAGEITILSGTVEGISAGGAGIGGGNGTTGSGSTEGRGGSGGTVVINGGIVSGISNDGAGIGGGSGTGIGSANGFGGSSGNLHFIDGIISGNSNKGAGIGGGYGGSKNESHGGNGDSITIDGGSVTAKSYKGAAIGGGFGEGHFTVKGGNGCDLTIAGGEINVVSEKSTAIGGGASRAIEDGDSLSGDGNKVIITGGTLKATSVNNGAGIGAGASEAETSVPEIGNPGSGVIRGGNIEMTQGSHDDNMLFYSDDSQNSQVYPISFTVENDDLASDVLKTISINISQLSGGDARAASTGGYSMSIDDAGKATAWLPEASNYQGDISLENYLADEISFSVASTSNALLSIRMYPQVNVVFDNVGNQWIIAHKGGRTLDDSLLIAPTRTGYDFKGWKSDYTGNYITSQISISNPMTLTADWMPIKYAVSYDYAGGQGNNPIDYTIESPEITLNLPVRSGYLFKGWSLKEKPEEIVASYLIPTGSTGDLSLVAHWEQEKVVPVPATNSHSDQANTSGKSTIIPKTGGLMTIAIAGAIIAAGTLLLKKKKD